MLLKSEQHDHGPVPSTISVFYVLSGWGLLQPDLPPLFEADGRMEKSHGGSTQPTMSHWETAKGTLLL